jgi:hypothetical protein
MRQTNSRTIAVIGVLATAVLTAFLVIPVSRQLAAVDGTWLAAVILLVPTLALLIATGFRYYGPWRSVAVAVGVMTITAAVTVVISAVAFAKALGGSITGALLAIVLFGGPALSVVVLGLLATRIAGAEQRADREHEHVG